MDRDIVALGVWLLTASVLGGQPAKGGEARHSKKTHTHKTVGDCKIRADVYRLPGEDMRPANAERFERVLGFLKQHTK